MADSIKERILQTAQADPFLSVEKIAKQVGTTQQYVRTILSEAGISLTKLRREYAKQMERKLGYAQDRGEEMDLEVPSHGRLEVSQIEAPQIAEMLGLGANTSLFQASAFTATGMSAPSVGLAQLITHHPLTLRADYNSLRELLPEAIGMLSAAKQWVVALPAPRALQETLGLGSSDTVFRLATLWVNQEGPAAIEFFWVQAEGHALTWSNGGEGLAFEVLRQAANR